MFIDLSHERVLLSIYKIKELKVTQIINRENNIINIKNKEKIFRKMLLLVVTKIIVFSMICHKSY